MEMIPNVRISSLVCPFASSKQSHFPGGYRRISLRLELTALVPSAIRLRVFVIKAVLCIISGTTNQKWEV